MNILHIAPYYPSLSTMHAGGVAMGKEVETLRKQGHEVYTLSFVQKKYDLSLFLKEKSNLSDAIVIDNKRKLKNIVCHPNVPFFFATRCDKEFELKIKKIVIEKNIEAIHGEYSAMLYYLRLKKNFPSLKFVIILHDVTYQSYSRKSKNEKNVLKKIFYTIECKRIKNFEKKWLKKADNVACFSNKDVKLLKNLYGISAKELVTYFNQEKMHDIRLKTKRKEDGFFSIGFIGQMGREENYEAALRLIEIYKSLKFENKKLYIIGANPPDKLKAYSNNNIVITGFVENIAKYTIENCDILCFPLINGAGVKIKVLEGMMSGIPVITNAIGAEGIDNGKYLILSETDEQILASIVGIKNKSLHYRSALEIESAFSWKKTESVLKEIYG